MIAQRPTGSFGTPSSLREALISHGFGGDGGFTLPKWGPTLSLFSMNSNAGQIPASRL